MHQLIYVKKRVLEWREAPEPTLQSPQEAIVRPFVAARCDTDVVPLFHNVTTPMKLGLALHYFDPLVRDMLGSDPFRGPYPFGHECVAEAHFQMHEQWRYATCRLWFRKRDGSVGRCHQR